MYVLARCCFGCSDIIILTCSIASKSPARLRRISRMSKTGSRRASRGSYSVTGIIRTQFCSDLLLLCSYNYRQRWHLRQGSAPTKIHHCKQDGRILDICIIIILFLCSTQILQELLYQTTSSVHDARKSSIQVCLKIILRWLYLILYMQALGLLPFKSEEVEKRLQEIVS